MQVTMDFTVYLRAKRAIEFAIDECINRASDAHDVGNTRLGQSWLLTRAEFIKTLDEFEKLPIKTHS